MFKSLGSYPSNCIGIKFKSQKTLVNFQEKYVINYIFKNKAVL